MKNDSVWRTMVTLFLFLAVAGVGSAAAGWETGDFDAAGTLRQRSSASIPAPGSPPRSGEFTPNIPVNDGLNPEHREPSVAVDGQGRLWAAYCERATHYNPELVMIAGSTDGGASWIHPAVRVNDTQPNAVGFPALRILGDGTLVLAWNEMKFAPYNYEVRFSRSVDGGVSWSPSIVVHPIDSAVDFLRPSLAVAGARILVSYWEEVAYPNARAVVVASDDGGVTWNPPVTVSTQYCSEDGAGPVLAYNELRGEVAVVLRSNDRRVLFCKSADAGDHWNAPVQINDVIATSVDYPDLVAAQGNYHVVWSDNRAGQYDTDIYYSRSLDGITFTADARVNDSFSGNQYEPHLSVDLDGGVHVCWIWCLPFQGNIDLYYSRSTDGELSWLAPCPRVNDQAYVVQPYVAWTSDILCDAAGVVSFFWNDGRRTDYYDDVYTCRSINPAAVEDERAGPEEGGIRPPSGPRILLYGIPGPSPQFSLSGRQSGASTVLSLYDVRGREVAHRPLPASSHGAMQLYLSWLSGGEALAPGVYWLRAADAEGESVVRVPLVR